jgi:hypothetical protein
MAYVVERLRARLFKRVLSCQEHIPRPIGSQGLFSNAIKKIMGSMTERAIRSHFGEFIECYAVGTVRLENADQTLDCDYDVRHADGD